MPKDHLSSVSLAAAVRAVYLSAAYIFVFAKENPRSEIKDAASFDSLFSFK